MPIYEYRCTECNSKYEVLHKSVNSQEEVICPQCNSKNNKKILSSFSSSIDGASSYSGGNSNDYGSSPVGGGCASGMCGLN